MEGIYQAGLATTHFATCRIRYVLVRNKFATYYFLWTTENFPLITLEKKIFYYISRSFKLAPPRVQVLDFANRKRHEYVGSELECSEQDSKKFPSRSRGQVDFLFAGRVTFKAHLLQEGHPLTKT